MNDFLSNVIAKNFDSLAVIQPRLPSLFEPPRAAGKLFAEQPAGGDELEPASPRIENIFDFAPAFTPARPRRPAITSLQVPHIESPPAPDAAIMTRRLETQEPPIQPRQSLRPATDEPPTATRATPMVQAALLPPRRDENVMEPFRNAPESPVVERTVIERVIAPTALQQSAVAPKGPSVIAQPQIKPYVAPILPAPVKAAEKSEPAPTIQVTIGRIEVRATPPAPPSKRQPATAPVMSLDDYLRQRAGGGTR